jgi:hypothetical protein
MDDVNSRYKDGLTEIKNFNSSFHAKYPLFADLDKMIQITKRGEMKAAYVASGGVKALIVEYDTCIYVIAPHVISC